MRTCPNCGNRKVNGLLCLNCGYDFKTKTAPRPLGGVSGPRVPAREADIWLGSFSSKRDFEIYFAEYDEYGQDEPISLFAEEQGLGFYDHDFFMAKHFRRTDDLERILSGIIVYDDQAKEIVARYQASGIGSFNFIAMQFDELSAPGKQRSVAGDHYTVHYLGRFAYSDFLD